MYIFNSLLHFHKYWYQGFFSFEKGAFCSNYGYFDCNLKFLIMSHTSSYHDMLSGLEVYAMNFLKFHGYYLLVLPNYFGCYYYIQGSVYILVII